ncbi:MAG TPA: hypothetical protein VF103_03410, partial [Polyangiaceae bacterium]
MKRTFFPALLLSFSSVTACGTEDPFVRQGDPHSAGSSGTGGSEVVASGGSGNTVIVMSGGSAGTGGDVGTAGTAGVGGGEACATDTLG